MCPDRRVSLSLTWNLDSKKSGNVCILFFTLESGDSPKLNRTEIEKHDKLLMTFQKETDLVLLTEEVFAKDGFQIREL